KRIWQLQNVKYLYEDSIIYILKSISINSLNDEFAPAIYKNSLVFASNTSKVKVIGRIDATNDKAFYNWYISNRTIDTTDRNVIIEYSKAEKFGKDIRAKYHKGSISFYPAGDTMVFAKTCYHHNDSKKYTTGIFFAKKENEQWTEFAIFPFNSLDYSINHPAISEDGKTIYFVSDMPGGKGGTDIYSSNFIKGKWTSPQNLGAEINTSQNDSHPFIKKNTLYFSSDGHPGFGGLDIFSVNLKDRPIEVLNFGFPINTHYDDFDLILDKTGIFGYLVSNRNNEDNTNDDIFEVYINKQSFPLIVNGKIKYKSSNIIDSTSEMVLLSNAKLELIDKSQNSIVYVTHTNAVGNFSIEIPYDSQFLLKVTQENFGVAIVSMEIPKNNLDHSNHEIVIVKDLFKSL
ncbi:MAG: PD40 domain-containing protein, partial [Cyclobacteriaceae bacterium]|nr:PD40 domain-containing protein [Cyclobacteriaceae bacterium]